MLYCRVLFFIHVFIHASIGHTYLIFPTTCIHEARMGTTEAAAETALSKCRLFLHKEATWGKHDDVFESQKNMLHA